MYCILYIKSETNDMKIDISSLEKVYKKSSKYEYYIFLLECLYNEYFSILFCVARSQNIY